MAVKPHGKLPKVIAKYVEIYRNMLGLSTKKAWGGFACTTLVFEILKIH